MSGKRWQRSSTTVQHWLVFVVWLCGFLTALEMFQQGDPGAVIAALLGPFAAAKRPL